MAHNRLTAFFNYVTARIKKYRREALTENYTAEGLRILTENTAKFAGGSSLKLSLADARAEAERPVDTRTSAEIKRSIVNGIRRL